MGTLLLNKICIWTLLWVILALRPAIAQQPDMVFETIERPPFSFLDEGKPAGFSIDLMNRVAQELGRGVRFQYSDNFPEMLSSVEAGTVDGAIANISITSAREEVMDFSQPIFKSGLQIMVTDEGGGSSIIRAVFSAKLMLAVLAAFAILFLLGLLMWLFERRKQDYFDKPAKEALFPSFWWALNLVVNGGFEERLPRSMMGRLLGVLMVISSLFVVSIFVANITASLTIEAISGSIGSVSDLNGRNVATTSGSTSSAFLDSRGVTHNTYASFSDLIAAFEDGILEAVVFDGPLLAFYVANDGAGTARLLAREYRPENYGIALPQGSAMREPINRALLGLTEAGVYRDLVEKWFGTSD